MPNCMGCSSSGAAAEQAVERAHGLGASRLLEDGEACLRLLQRGRDEATVLPGADFLELVLDVREMELLLVDDALERLAVLAAVQAAEVHLELIVREPLDRVDAGEHDDAPELRRQRLDERALRRELL